MEIVIEFVVKNILKSAEFYIKYFRIYRIWTYRMDATKKR